MMPQELKLEITGTNGAWTTLRWPCAIPEFDSGFILVTLGHRDARHGELAAEFPIAGVAPGRFHTFFEEIALQAQQRDWEVAVESEYGDLALRCCSNNPQEVWLYVCLASDIQDPYWRVDLRLELDRGDLPDLAARAAAFFAAISP